MEIGLRMIRVRRFEGGIWYALKPVWVDCGFIRIGCPYDDRVPSIIRVGKKYLDVGLHTE